MDLWIYAKSGFVWGLTVLLLCLLIMPAFRFLVYGWNRKRLDVINALTDESFDLYFKQFYPNDKIKKTYTKADFERNFNSRFGRRHYFFPALLLLAVSGFSLFLVCGSIGTWLGILPKTAGALKGIAVAAISGAYMWVLGDLITKGRCANISPVTLSWGAFRFVTAIPFGYSFSYMLAENLGIPIAFLIGAFPTQKLRRVGARFAARKMDIGELEEKNRVNQLERLQCINTSNAESFADEGITNILQLAYTDSIDLAIRTSFSFNYVIDCVSQALAWIYFEDDMEKLRRFSLRGAQEIANLMADFEDEENPEAKASAKACIKLIAKELNREPDAVERAFREIADDPYTQFLVEIWQ